MQTGQRNLDSTSISKNRREMLQTGIKSTKNTEEMTTGGHTPLKETSTTDYWNSTKDK